VGAAIADPPAGVAQAPSALPGWKTFASIAVLGTVCTAVAYLLFFTIIARAGAGYAALVTYLVPPVALAYGAIFLDESIGWAAIAGLALILAGVTLGTGARRVRWLAWSSWRRGRSAKAGSTSPAASSTPATTQRTTGS
jgi:drug/metabolite transporter (DMT)-like permease